MSILITRRQTLQSLATATVFASGLGGMMFSLAGCGGGGGGDDTPGGGKSRARTVAVQVTVPAGPKAPAAASLQVWTSGGLNPLSGEGASKATILNDGPQYAAVRDAQRGLVLVGFVGPDRKALDATTTAEAFAYFALGAGGLKEEGRLAVLNGVRGLSGFDAIVNAVNAQVAANGVVSRDGDLEAAIHAFVAANPQSKGRAASGRGTLVQPSASASGLSLDTLIDEKLTITNSYLRRGHVWLERTGYKLKDGTENTELVPVEDFDLKVPARYGGFTGTVADILSGNYAYTPETMPTNSIPLFPVNAEQTTYKLTTVGVGGIVGDYPKLSQERKDIRDVIALKAIVLDLILPVVSNILLPLKGDEFDEFAKMCDANTLLSDAINTLLSTVPEVLSQLNEGQFVEAALSVWKSGFGSNSMLPILSGILLNLIKEQVLGRYEYAEVAERFANTMGIFGAVDVTASCFDTALMISDWANSNHADIFEITTIATKVTLIATPTTAPKNQPISVRANLLGGNPDLAYRYEWSVGTTYTLTDENGKTSDADGKLLTTSANVEVRSKGPEGSATVTCKVTRGGGEIVVGTASTSVTFRDVALVTGVPEGTVVSRLETINGNGYVFYLVVYVAVPNIEGAVFYRNLEKPVLDSQLFGGGKIADFTAGTTIKGDEYRIQELLPPIPAGVTWLLRDTLRYISREKNFEAAQRQFNTIYPRNDQYLAEWRASTPWTWQVEFTA